MLTASVITEGTLTNGTDSAGAAVATDKVVPVDAWPSFASYLLRRFDRFVSEQSEAWSAICSLSESTAEAGETPGALASARTLAEAAAQFERTGRRLLVAPYEKCGYLRPIARSLNAIEDLDREVASHAGAAECANGTHQVVLLRARIDGAMQLVLCRTCLRLGQSWSTYLSREVGRNKRDGTSVAIDRERMQSAETLERYRQWIEDALIYLTFHRNRRRVRETLVRRHDRHLEFWRGRQRPVTGILELEIGIWKTGLESLRAADAVLTSLKREGDGLRRRLRLLVQYLEKWRAEPFSPPAIDTRIAGPEERIESWQSRISGIVERILPERLMIPQPRSDLPFVIERNGQTRPRKMYLRALRYEVLPVVEEQFQSRIQFHLAVAATLVRAEQVVRYALEASPEKPGTLVTEALQNAIALLRDCDDSSEWGWDESEASIARALLICASEMFTWVRSGNLGVAALVARRLKLTFTARGRQSAIRDLQSLLQPAVEAAVQRSDALLVDIGWNEPERPLPPPVAVRSEIRELRAAGSATKRSTLYHQLFQLTPVEDPRFLVGREAEIDGFCQAYDAWCIGRFAACVMIGEPGSGKSSLLSCVIPQIFEKETVVRCELTERLSSRQDLELFLRSGLSIPTADLVDGIRASRQVIILERVERAFLKTIAGFDAIRGLVELIHATASSTLWIIVLNAGCFELLDAALDLGNFFSHRVNAMGVRSEIIKRAILQRHYLSGLKLSFPELRRRALPAALGLTTDPQKAFFAALHRQSGGNFRSALELWLSSIESADDGIIRLKEAAAPDYRLFRQELRQPDQFTLLSLDQHGSLTVSEVAAVLCEPEQVSRTRLDRLMRMGMLEEDSEMGGIRIRPAAQHTVEELLHSVNLT